MAGINLASRYSPLLQKIYKKETLTGVLEGNTLVREIEGAPAHTVYLPKTSMSGLADYSKANGYASGSVDLDWESVTLSYDRGQKFSIDAVDNIESLDLCVANVMGEFVRTKVVPEVDAVRFAKIAQGTESSMRANASISANNVLTAIDTASKALDEAEVTLEGRILFCTPAVFYALKQKIDANRMYTNGTDNVGRGITMFDGMRVIVVPPTRFYAGITLGSGSYTNVGSAINFMVVDPQAVVPVTKHQELRAFAPDVNQNADAYIFNYRLYHDCFIAPNKSNGIYLHTATAYATTG